MQTTKPETAQQRPTGARMALLMFFTLISTFPLCYWCVWSAMAGNYFKNRLSIAQSAVFVNYLSGRMAE